MFPTWFLLLFLKRLGHAHSFLSSTNINTITMFNRVQSYESTVSLDSSDLRDVQESQTVFESVETVEELQQRTIDFLQGRLSATSYHFGPLMAESGPLVDTLVRLNSLGFITTNSQPGCRYTERGATIGQRCFVEGLLKKRYFSLFVEKLYRATGNSCFIVNTQNEFSFEEIKQLEHEDRYWLTRSEIAGTKQGITHIPEYEGIPCTQFQTCQQIYPLLVDEYVNVCILDTEWYRPSFLLEKVGEVLHALMVSETATQRKSMRMAMR